MINEVGIASVILHYIIIDLPNILCLAMIELSGMEDEGNLSNAISKRVSNFDSSFSIDQRHSFKLSFHV